ncbi:hypothetical protein NP233_g6252 [Leucocoprinus birnbaumii]|uniref:Uncharacterized protein n=1 Tax=Leucocoprinus birnbaumii TaxID=56174 RepID=A0AAD5YR40_9AGAR|nr:hypothetical protein NP233_g6252 [Leucocoprinus birnbaumii]
MDSMESLLEGLDPSLVPTLWDTLKDELKREPKEIFVPIGTLEHYKLCDSCCVLLSRVPEERLAIPSGNLLSERKDQSQDIYIVLAYFFEMSPPLPMARKALRSGSTLQHTVTFGTGKLGPHINIVAWWKFCKTPSRSDFDWYTLQFSREIDELKITVSTCLALISCLYYTPSPEDEITTPFYRLEYGRNPISDFGICKGKISRNDTLYPENHYWLYYTTATGDEVFLDCNASNFGMNIFVDTTPLLRRLPDEPDSVGKNGVPVLFMETDDRGGHPFEPIEKRFSAPRDSEFHRATFRISLIEQKQEDVDAVQRFIDNIRGDPTTPEQINTVWGQLGTQQKLFNKILKDGIFKELRKPNVYTKDPVPPVLRDAARSSRRVSLLIRVRNISGYRRLDKSVKPIIGSTRWIKFGITLVSSWTYSRYTMAVESQLIIFDFDWSMADQDSDHWTFEVLAPDLRRKFDELVHTAHWTDIVAQFLEEIHKRGIKREQIEDALRIMPFHPGMIRAVNKLKQEGKTTFLCLSSANTIFISTILKDKGLESLFTEIITNPAVWEGDLLKLRRKIDPDGPQHNCSVGCAPNMCKGEELTAFLERQGNQFDRMIYVGDGSNDFCPSLRLREQDIVFCRVNRGLHRKILKEGVEGKRLLVVRDVSTHNAPESPTVSFITIMSNTVKYGRHNRDSLDDASSLGPDQTEEYDEFRPSVVDPGAQAEVVKRKHSLDFSAVTDAHLDKFRVNEKSLVFQDSDIQEYLSKQYPNDYEPWIDDLLGELKIIYEHIVAFRVVRQIIQTCFRAPVFKYNLPPK